MKLTQYRLHVLAFTFVSLPLAGILATAQSAAPPRAAAAAMRDAMDRTIDPCTNFYAFACGGWLAHNPVPADRQRWGRFQEVQDRNYAVLRRILETKGSDADRRKASDYYAACMAEPAIDAKGVMPLQADLAQIDGLKSRDELPELVARLHALGVNVLFRFRADTDRRNASAQIADVDQGGLSLPDREYYLKTDARSVDLRDTYAAHVQRMLGLLRPGAGRAAEAAAVSAFERTLAEGELDRVKRRDPATTDHQMRLEQLQALTPGFDWKRYAAAAGAPAFQRINVNVPDFMKALDRALGSTSIDDLKTYFRWHLVHASASMLPKTFEEADFDFFNRTLAGQQEQPPRWRECVVQTDALMGEALGKAFVEEAFGPQAKPDMLKMVRAIKTVMKQDIDAAPWMSEETRRAANRKLEAVVDRIGYPDKWRDYRARVVARDDALGNMQRARAFERRRNLAKIGRPVDRGEWDMTPPTVNAYYSPDRNNINFPAGILQPPFYLAGRDAALNYGGAGAVIGHELTHGFDDEGRHYDGQGNLREWWTEADGKAFETRASCIADQYSEYVVAGDAKINGRLTLGENVADNGGLRLALLAYLAGPGATEKNVIDGLTPEQRVFVGWAQVWCENATPEAERLKAATNPHSSNMYRANGVVSNMPEFQKAFSCRGDAPMVRQNACRVW